MHSAAYFFAPRDLQIAYSNGHRPANPNIGAARTMQGKLAAPPRHAADRVVAKHRPAGNRILISLISV